MNSPDNIKKRILIAEDDPSIRKLMEVKLKFHGYEVKVTSDGARAMETLANETFDVILVDLNMPVIDGLKLIKWARDEQNIKTPIIVVTALSKQMVKDKVLEAGATDILFKPGDIEFIVDKIKSFENG